MKLLCSASSWLVYLFLEFDLDLIGKCIGEEAKYEGIRLLFDGLQQPVLNKQVTHNVWQTCLLAQDFLKWMFDIAEE